MRIHRNSTNTRIAVYIDSEAERLLVDKMFKRSLNTWEPQPPALLAAHEQLKAPLAPCVVPMPAVFRSNRPLPVRCE